MDDLIEQKVRAYRQLAIQIEELQERKKALSAEILQLIPQGASPLRIAEFQVRRMSRLLIKTSLESAKLFKAVKIEETVDKVKIKKLYQMGMPVPDVSEFHFIQVSQPQREKIDETAAEE